MPYTETDTRLYTKGAIFVKILWTTLHVNNLDRSIRFYRELVGLRLLRRFEAGDREIAFLGYGKADETLLELVSEQADVQFTESVSIGFEVESLDAMLPVLETKNIALTGGPFVGPGHAFLFVADPDGMTVQLFENRS